MVLTETIAKKWARVGQRATFGLVVLELAKNDNSLIALTADVSTSAGLERLKKTLPEQFLDVGIAEQNMMGIAAGLASEGYRVITATFAPFQTMRCLEQIRVNMGYMQTKVCMVGLASGIALSTLGNTHCCLEDIAVLRGIPNIAIISPADCGEVAKAVEAAMEYPESVYIRLMGTANMPIIYKEDYKFEIGKGIILEEGKDIAIITNGTMVSESIKTAEVLREKGISVKVVNMHTIKPIDRELVDKICDEVKLVVTIEEHNIIGGLGSAVAECKTVKRNAPPQLFIGLPDQYSKGGMYKELLNGYGLNAEQMAENIYKFYHQEEK